MRGLLYSNMPRSVSPGRMRWSLTGTMVCCEPQGRSLFHGEEFNVPEVVSFFVFVLVCVHVDSFVREDFD